ncbi:30S ribosomal protein S5 [Candidatus Methylacidiphilum infernorum]
MNPKDSHLSASTTLLEEKQPVDLKEEEQGIEPKGGRKKIRRHSEKRDFKHEETYHEELMDKVIHVNRCAKVVKGGRRYSFGALVVVGDRAGQIGIGFGKANEVADAVKKATESARKKMRRIVRNGDTIPHEVIGEFCGGKVLMKPASPGTGIIAGVIVRSILEAAGIKDVLTKSLGSKNPYNVAKATFKALLQLKSRDEVLHKRGKDILLASQPNTE